MRCPGKEAIEAHFMSAVKEVTTVLTLSNSQSVAFYNNFKILLYTHCVPYHGAITGVQGISVQYTVHWVVG